MTTTTTTTALAARGVTLAYDGDPVFEGLDLEVETGRVTTFIGANGSGKSTLLKALGRVLRPGSGTVELDGAPIRSLPTREVARRLAILPQKPLTPTATSVRDLVARGRHPHQSMFRPWTAADAAAVDAALAATGMAALADRDAGSLSGGQLQRAWIALVLAQEAPVVLLDEPTTFLDLTHQLDVLRLVRSINRTRGTTVVMVLHDLSLAARYSDRLVVLGRGRVLADGAPWDVLTPEVLRDAFDLDARVVPDPSCGTPLVVPVEPAGDHAPVWVG
ncbi:iron complex transport system ATP-binding protein [Klenkia soli]|uniref:Iron complex transport system ATP-binding protein n=1 Tax=Klenkia soli TaxID=1052260 RepID=A0A1H0L1Y1_9ACTN|nr:ABC transporter ATP-binding protein [Klenkia soli]SDO61990.1 iron complex transport system ATP-binding protein [Klenkia soli]